MEETKHRLTFGWRVVAVHVSTYMIVGLSASVLLDYAAQWKTASLSHMRPLDSIWVAAGPALQPVRALVLAAVLYPLRARILEQPRGWAVLWGLLVGVGVLATYVGAPGSLEGIIYTTVPIGTQLLLLPEVLLQTLLFSLFLVGWYRRPHPAWGWVFGVLTGLTMLLSGGGSLALLLTGGRGP